MNEATNERSWSILSKSSSEPSSKIAPGHSPHRPQVGVLFVCLGNICRSPLAEGIFLHHARSRGVADLFDVDSCGTGGWHADAVPDPRSIAVAALRSITLDHRARQLDPRSDFIRFHHVLAMDRSNFRDIVAAGETHGIAAPNIRLMLAPGPVSEGTDLPRTDQIDVPDPYYGGADGFERVFEMLDFSCKALLEELLENYRG